MCIDYISICICAYVYFRIGEDRVYMNRQTHSGRVDVLVYIYVYLYLFISQSEKLFTNFL